MTRPGAKGGGAGADAGAQKQVEERRLRPIYDWLDNGNNKKALQEAERVLKKQPDLQCAKVLMALAMQRMGRNAEAEELLEKVMAEKPTRDDVLHSMAIAFKDMNQNEKITLMYENAVGVEPRNEELLTQLFMSYVRLDAYKKQQSCAMQLYRAAPKNPYYFWGVMSLLLQAQNSSGAGQENEKVARTVLLLAERMVAKLEADGKMEQEQETHIYLMVLEMQHKFREALAILDGPLGTKLTERSCYLNYAANKRLEYMKKLEMWSDVNVFVKEMLRNSPDQWSVYLDYVTSVFHVLDKKKKKGESNHVNSEEKQEDDDDEDLDDSLSSARAFLLSQKDLVGDTSSLRGPFLAEIEFKCRLLARREEDEEEWTQVKLLDLMCAYFSRFGHKSVCVSDLKLFVLSLETEEQKDFLSRCMATVEVNEDGVPKSLDEVNRHVCLYMLERFSGQHQSLSPERGGALAEELQRLFFACQDMASACTPNELRPSDMYLVIASHVLWQLWTDTGSDAYFWKAVVPMEHALRQSRPNYHIRFMLVKFYNHAGAVGQADTVHQQLELKHIQLDSLGHLLIRHIFTQAHFKKASIMCGNALKFYTSNFKECVDYIVNCYRFGTFPKIQEFLGVRDRVASSQHYRTLSTEWILVDLLVETAAHEQAVKAVSYLDIDPAKEGIAWKELVDSRDFKAMASFDPPDKTVSDDMIAESFMLEQRFLRLRSLTVRAFVAAVHLSSPTSSSVQQQQQSANDDTATSKSQQQQQSGSHLSESPEVLVQVLKDLLASLDENADLSEKECQGCRDEQFLNPVQGPDRPRLILYVRFGHHRLLALLLRLVLKVYHFQHPPTTPSDQEGGDGLAGGDAASALVKKISSSFEEMASKLAGDPSSARSLLSVDGRFEQMVNAVEASSFICIMAGVCRNLLKSKRKGKKKKEANPKVADFSSCFNEMLDSVDKSLESLLDLAAAMVKETEVDKLSSSSSSSSDLSAVFSKIRLGGDGDSSSFPTSPAEEMDSLQQEVAKWIDSSHQYSLWELQNVARNKSAYLKGLRL